MHQLKELSYLMKPKELGQIPPQLVMKIKDNSGKEKDYTYGESSGTGDRPIVNFSFFR